MDEENSKKYDDFEKYKVEKKLEILMTYLACQYGDIHKGAL